MATADENGTLLNNAYINFVAKPEPNSYAEL